MAQEDGILSGCGQKYTGEAAWYLLFHSLRLLPASSSVGCGERASHRLERVYGSPPARGRFAIPSPWFPFPPVQAMGSESRRLRLELSLPKGFGRPPIGGKNEIQRVFEEPPEGGSFRRRDVSCWQLPRCGGDERGASSQRDVAGGIGPNGKPLGYRRCARLCPGSERSGAGGGKHFVLARQ